MAAGKLSINVFALFFGANLKSFRCVTLRSCTIQSSAKAVMISPFSLLGPLKAGHVLLLMLAEEAAEAKNRKQELIDYMRTFKKHQIFSSATPRGGFKR